MTNVFQTSRAGPPNALSGLDVKPAEHKDSPAGSSFTAILAKKLGKGRGSRGEEPDPASSRPESESESPETPLARKKEPETPPAPLANAQAAPAQPVEPPPSGDGKAPGSDGAEAGGSAVDGPQGLASEAQNPGAKAAVSGAGVAVDPAQAAAADVKGAEGDQAVVVDPNFAQAVQAAQDAGVQPAAAEKASQKAEKTKVEPEPEKAVPAGMAAMAAREAANVRQPAVSDLPAPAPAHPATQARETEKIQAQVTTKTSSEAPATQAASPEAAPPGQAAANARVVQVSTEGTRSTTETSSIFEPARLAEAQTKGMVYQISQNVEAMLKNRQTTLRVMLYPEELGRIDLRLTAGSGGMGVSLVAHQDSTNQLLESQMSQLRQALDQAGIHLANLSVGQQQSQAGSSQPERRQRGQAAQRLNSPTAEPAVEDRMVLSSLQPSEGFDYRI